LFLFPISTNSPQWIFCRISLSSSESMFAMVLRKPALLAIWRSCETCLFLIISVMANANHFWICCDWLSQAANNLSEQIFSFYYLNLGDRRSVFQYSRNCNEKCEIAFSSRISPTVELFFWSFSLCIKTLSFKMSRFMLNLMKIGHL
jgi:hypothetical protein